MKGSSKNRIIVLKNLTHRHIVPKEGFISNLEYFWLNFQGKNLIHENYKFLILTENIVI